MGSCFSEAANSFNGNIDSGSPILRGSKRTDEIDLKWKEFKKYVQPPGTNTKYYHHGTLKSLVEKKLHEFSLKEIEHLFTGIVKGCFWIHQSEVVLFNLNPDNIMLTCENEHNCKNDSPLHMRPVITNFELALVFDEIALNKAPFNNSNYIDDQLKSPYWRSNGGVESDIYSLGKILYFLMFKSEYPTQKVAETLSGNLNKFLKQHPTLKHYARFVMQSCSYIVEQRPSHADIYLDFLAPDLATDKSHFQLQAHLQRFDTLQNDWRVLCIGGSSPVYRLGQLAETASKLDSIGNYNHSESYSGLQIAPEIRQGLNSAADFYSSILLSEFCLLEFKVEALHRGGLISKKLFEIWKNRNAKPRSLQGKNDQKNSVINQTVAKIQDWKTRTFDRNLLDEIQREKKILLEKLTVHLAKACKPSYDSRDHQKPGKNALVAHFEKPDNYPLFGIIYLWTNRLELLQNTFDQIFWDQKGLLNEVKSSTIAERIQTRFLEQIDRMARLSIEAFLSQCSVESQRFNQLGLNNPEFLMSAEPFKKAGQAWIYEGYWVTSISQRVVYKMMLNSNQGTTTMNPFYETDLVAQIPENPHLLKPWFKLIKTGHDIQKKGINEKIIWEKFTNSEAYIVSEYFENGNLHDYVLYHRGPLELNLIEFILKGILSGMQAIRANDLIHRDLTPKNIVLAKWLVPKILDFGISLQGDPMLQLMTIQEAENAHYRAPEIPNAADRNAPVFDSRVDVWSVGLIAYYMLFKRTPLTDEEWNSGRRYTEKNTGQNLLIPEHRYNTERFWEFLDLIKSCLVADPTYRIGWADLFNHSLINLSLKQDNKEANLVSSSSMENMLDRVRCYYQVLEVLPEAKFGASFDGELSAVRRLLVWMMKCDLKELNKQFELAITMQARHYMNQQEQGQFIANLTELEGLVKRLSDDVQEGSFDPARRQGLFFERAKALHKLWKERPSQPGEQTLQTQRSVLGWLWQLGHKTDDVPPNLSSQGELAEKFQHVGQYNFQHFLDSPKYA